MTGEAKFFKEARPAAGFPAAAEANSQTCNPSLQHTTYTKQLYCWAHFH